MKVSRESEAGGRRFGGRSPAPGRLAGWRALPAIALLALTLPVGCSPDVDSGPLVFAAASLQDALREVAEEFERRQSGSRVLFNFAGSNVLARQIEAGASADVFVSADEAWMDDLEERGLLQVGTRRSVASNHLVVISSRDASFEMESISDLTSLQLRHLAMGDPDAVPAGRYARRYLEGIPRGDGNLWQWARPLVVPAPDVRAALALVEADPDIVGIVYASDALVSAKVRVLYEVAPGEGPAIHYVGAVPSHASRPEQGESFLRFLCSSDAAAILHRYGFGRDDP